MSNSLTNTALALEPSIRPAGATPWVTDTAMPALAFIAKKGCAIRPPYHFTRRLLAGKT